MAQSKGTKRKGVTNPDEEEKKEDLPPSKRINSQLLYDKDRMGAYPHAYPLVTRYPIPNYSNLTLTPLSRNSNVSVFDPDEVLKTIDLKILDEYAPRRKPIDYHSIMVSFIQEFTKLEGVERWGDFGLAFRYYDTALFLFKKFPIDDIPPDQKKKWIECLISIWDKCISINTRMMNEQIESSNQPKNNNWWYYCWDSINQTSLNIIACWVKKGEFYQALANDASALPESNKYYLVQAKNCYDQATRTAHDFLPNNDIIAKYQQDKAKATFYEKLQTPSPHTQSLITNYLSKFCRYSKPNDPYTRISYCFSNVIQQELSSEHTTQVGSVLRFTRKEMPSHPDADPMRIVDGPFYPMYLNLLAKLTDINEQLANLSNTTPEESSVYAKESTFWDELLNRSSGSQREHETYLDIKKGEIPLTVLPKMIPESVSVLLSRSYQSPTHPLGTVPTFSSQPSSQPFSSPPQAPTSSTSADLLTRPPVPPFFSSSSPPPAAQAPMPSFTSSSSSSSSKNSLTLPPIPMPFSSSLLLLSVQVSLSSSSSPSSPFIDPTPLTLLSSPPPPPQVSISSKTSSPLLAPTPLSMFFRPSPQAPIPSSNTSSPQEHSEGKEELKSGAPKPGG